MTGKDTKPKTGPGSGRGGPRERSGRPRGIPNKVNGGIKEMILEAIAIQPGGGTAYFARQAVENPGPFMALVRNILPKDVVFSSPVRIIVETGMSASGEPGSEG